MEYFKGIIHVESAQKMTKEEVYKAVKGHLNIDFEVFYKELTSKFKINESVSKLGKPSKKS